ncbi:MAG TPA: hypothetical protein VMI31_09940 [Fimbriimonadaceae bacterium]|nr:hypothetical protein [Fimbriimonadaceae bacterium]
MPLTLDDPGYHFLKMTAGALATFGMYSVLYKETRIYRFFEHMFLGLAAGLSLTLLWTQTLYDLWWGPLVGRTADKAGEYGQNGAWPWILVLPLAALAYTIFSKKHNWMSRIPIGLLIGISAGQTIQNWFNQYGPQIENSIKPAIPTDWSRLAVPDRTGLPLDALDRINNNVYGSQAINNLVFLVTLLCVLSYFIFCTDFKSKFTRGMSTAGRLMLMVGFGAIFGTTIMTRFALLIDRMYFVWVEWLLQGLPRMLHGG